MIIEITAGENTGATFRLGHKPVGIGRDQVNPIQLIDEKVSRRHAVIRWDGKHWHIHDLASHNGVHVNGALTATAKLNEGDTLVIGETHLKVTSAWRIVVDASTGDRVADPAVIARATCTADLQQSMSAAIKRRETIDTDSVGDVRELLNQRALFGLKRAISDGRSPKEVVVRATDALLERLEPDRIALLYINQAKKVRQAARRCGPNVTPEEKALTPWMGALAKAMKIGRPYVDPQLGQDAGLLGSVLVVPVVHEGAVVGAVYLDSLRRSRQAFTDEDAAFAQEVATLLTPLIATLRAADQ